MKEAPSRFLNATFFTDGLQVKLNRHALDAPFPLHWHEFYELTFITEGSGINSVNGVDQAISAGDAFLLTPADFHAIAPARGGTLKHFNLIFSQVMLSDEMLRLIFADTLSRYARFGIGAAFDAMTFRLESLMKECETAGVGRKLAAQSELNRIVIEWHRQRDQTQQTPNDKKLKLANHHHTGIQKSLIYIQHHFRQAITLEDAAQHAHLSANYFSELFRKSTGVTFQKYLQQLRLQFAQSLLQTSPLPVTEVSYVSGFNTLTHFERAFRLEFGMTPSEVQRRKGLR
jgi:AraC-like DNA-binding protein